MRNIKLWNIAFLSGIMLLGSCGDNGVENEDGITAWDVDKSGDINHNEFEKQLESWGKYTDWDEDEDKFISEEEFSENAFNKWDVDGDGVIERGEYSGATSIWLIPWGSGGFSDLDQNNNDQLEREEYNAIVMQSGLYGEKEEGIPQDRFVERMFIIWDTDRDGIISRDEYENRSNVKSGK